MIPMTTIHSKLSLLLDHSAYAVRWLTARPEWSLEIGEMAASPVSEAVIDGLLKAALPTQANQVQSIDDLAANLRLARQKFMLLIAARDFNGAADVQEVTQAMSCFAEKVTAVAIEAIRQDIKPMVGEPLNQHGDYSPMMIVGMGKLGGRELNVSSDIDLVFLYEEEGETQGGSRSISHQEWYTRVGKRLIALLSELRSEGFIFRVDMRLRPNGDSGPLVCSLGMLEEYFCVQGREWERYAWIKGRMIYP